MAYVNTKGGNWIVKANEYAPPPSPMMKEVRILKSDGLGKLQVHTLVGGRGDEL